MMSLNEIKALFREKSGKKLVLFSVVVFLVLTGITFFMVYRIIGINSLNEIDEYLGEIPEVIENRKKELDMRTRVYEEDVLARAELGTLCYQGETGLPDAESLERVRSTVSAESVSLLDEKGKLLSTTGHVSPEEIFNGCIQTLEPGKLHLEYFPAASKDGEQTSEILDGKGFIRLPLTENSRYSLVYEFQCDKVLKLINALTDWSEDIGDMVDNGNISLFARIGDKLKTYSKDGFTSEQISQISEKLTKVFQNGKGLLHTPKKRPVKFLNMLGRIYLAVQMRYEPENTDLLMTVPFRSVVGNGICIALSISVIIGWGMALFLIYAYRRLQLKKEGRYTEDARRKWNVRATRPGILLMLVITFVFSDMLLVLENRTHANLFAISSRMEVQQEIAMRKSYASMIRRDFEDYYLRRAEMLASFLTDHPEYQTREGLKELNRIAGTDYLMRFDRDGKETLSSNTYTGFSTDMSLGAQYRAVQLGYPYYVTEPAADPYMGRIQMGAAVLMTDAEGQSDGFLLAVYSAADLKAELERMSETSAINEFVVQEGQIAAAISDKDGCFTAHTNPRMIGQKAMNVLKDYEPGISFEGFSEYGGKQVCVSAHSEDGRMLLYIVPQKMSAEAMKVSVLAGLAALLILLLLFHPKASMLMAQAMEEAKGSLKPRAMERGPLTVFSDGYPMYLTLFVFLTLLACATGLWTTFDYVFSWQWTKGLNLFSIWAALFILAVTLCIEYVICAMLDHLENRLIFKNKTATRLVKSLVVYGTVLFLVFRILSILGVNTTALLASAGVISIAVGMGAQSMAADLLAGFFMMLEGSIHVGDYVTAGGVTGHVTDMGIRTTEITDDNGNIVLLNNSKVSPVTNRTHNHEETEKKNLAEKGNKK